MRKDTEGRQQGEGKIEGTTGGGLEQGEIGGPATD